MAKEVFTTFRKATISSMDTGYCRIYYTIPFERDGKVCKTNCCFQEEGRGADTVVLYTVNDLDGYAEPDYPVTKPKDDIFFQLPKGDDELERSVREHILAKHNFYGERTTQKES